MYIRLLLLWCLFPWGVGAQANEPGPTPPADTTLKVLGLPLVFYTPDTRLGLGAAGVLSFRGQPLRSSVTFSVAYTLRKQFLLWFPYQWFSPQGQWRAFGELGWYRYLYQYFGVGNEYPAQYLEKYTAQFPRLRASVLRRLAPGQYAGLRLGFDDYRIIETESQGDIAEGKLVGSQGGWSSAGGLVWLLDHRDSPFFSRKGWLVDVSCTGEHPSITGSDFRYLRFTADAARYISLTPKQVLAIHSLVDLTQGQPPFFLLPSIGGTKKLRAYPDGKYRDRNMALLQAELRLPLFWRFKGVVFAGAGAVWGSPHERVRLRPNGGAGLRFELDPQQHLHLRADYGIGQGASGFYLTVGEAF